MLKRKKTQTTRNPNVTGRPSRQVFSYHSSRSTPEPERSRKDIFDQQTVVLNKSYKHIPTYIAIFVIIASLIYTTILDVSSPQVKTLASTTPNILRTNQEYSEGLSQILSEKIINRSKISIDTKSISEEIKLKYPELESASVILPLLGKRPVIQISPATPVLVIKTVSQSFVVGSNGKALLDTDDISTDQIADLPVVKDKITQTLEAGQLALSLDTLEFINSLLFQFKSRNITVDQIVLPEIANELHVKPKDSIYLIKFDLQNNALAQAGGYFALVEHLAKNNLAQPKEYIDVRIEERAYYK